jgi:hypothetical protein
MGEKRNTQRFLVEKPERTRSLELVADERIILSWILEK